MSVVDPTATQLEPLAALLEVFADPTCTSCRWECRFALGMAGYITLTIDVVPGTLSEHDRDVILSTVARLTNWQATR